MKLIETFYNIKVIFKSSVYFILFLVLSFAMFNSSTFAQSSQALDIKLTPSNPKIGENFTAEVETFSFDLDRSDITWLLDGQVVKKGFGEKSVDLTMIKGAKNLLVKAVSPEGTTYAGGVSMVEKSLGILFEGSDSYVPDWYEGKREVASGGKLRAVAIANIDDGNGKYLDNKDLIFTWEINGEIQSKVSGAGKYYADLYVLDEYGSSAEVTVTVKAREGGESVSETIQVPVYNTDVLVYKKDSVYGIIQKAILGGINIVNNGDVEFIAEPFYFSTDRFKTKEMKYVWSMNGKALQGNNYSRIFQLADQTGSSNISVYVENIKKIMQEATRNFTISF